MLEHKHIIIRAKVNKPPHNQVWTQEWFEDLIRKIGMKLLRGPISAYVTVPGNKGMTCVAIIETSHIAMHVWDEQSPALMQFDVYTCGALDVEKVFEAMQVFEPTDMEYMLLDREHFIDIKEMDKR
jgi:hypothetical protein